MIQIFTGLMALGTVIKELISIGIALFNFVRTEYEREQRVALTKEIKEAVQESIATGDNTRLANVFNPQAEPFPRVTPK